MDYDEIDIGTCALNSCISCCYKDFCDLGQNVKEEEEEEREV